MSSTITFNSNSIFGDEILKINISRSASLSLIETFEMKKATQLGSIDPVNIEIECKLMSNAHTRFFDWLNMLNTFTLSTLTLLNTNMGSYYLIDVNMTTSDLANDGTILWCELSLKFQQSIDFANT